MGSAASKRQTENHPEQNGIQNTADEEFMDDDTQRIVLVTGCSSGIGLEIAACLANDQNKRFKVYATMRDTGKRHPLEEAAKDVVGERLIVKQLDVCVRESIRLVVKEIIDTEQRLDVLVNNAGVAVFSPAECVSDDVINNIYNTNLFGVIHLTNEVIPHMKSRESGHIINIGSVYGLTGLPFGEYYCSSKFAVEGFTESLAPILQKFNIRTTMISPGPVTTQFNATAKSVREQTDISTTDDKTRDLLKETLMSYYQLAIPRSQETSVIADTVKKALLLKNPNYRYLPNPTYRQKEISIKFKDKDGNGIRSLYSQGFAMH